MNIHHVVPYIGEKASGPAHTVPALCRELGKRSPQVCLHILDHHQLQKESFEIRSYPRKNMLKQLGFSPAMSQELKKVSQAADIIHNHSLWMMPNIYAGRYINFDNHCKLVVSPRGTLSPWAWSRSRWKKRIIWLLGQKQTMTRASCFHATSEEEAEDIRRLGFRQPIAVIPNGVYLPKHYPRSTQKGQTKRLLFLARIHPKKGLDFLLRAWQQIQNDFPDWELCIVGQDHAGYQRQLKKLVHHLKLSRVSFPGPVYGTEKTKMFFSADLYVLPTHTENFGISIAEALAHGVPVITTKGAPWRELTEKKCGWWIDIGVEPLVACLEAALKCPADQLVGMGEAGRQWMKEDYSWDQIGKMMNTTYIWLINGEACPPWVKS